MITIMNDQLMVERYEELLQVTSHDICLRLSDRQMTISGSELTVLALTRDEILIQGKLERLQFHDAS